MIYDNKKFINIHRGIIVLLINKKTRKKKKSNQKYGDLRKNTRGLELSPKNTYGNYFESCQATITVTVVKTASVISVNPPRYTSDIDQW